MTEHDYVAVFDVTDAGFKDWHASAFGLLFVVLGLLLLYLKKSGVVRTRSPLAEKWFLRLLIAFAVVWTLFVFIASFSDYRRATTAMRDHHVPMIEGVVADFHPGRASGHGMESFIVNNVKFAYSDYVGTAGFNTTATHGGPIRGGLRVRIWHLNGEILRLEIQKP